MNDKRSRILDAAQSLFLRYGVKRTSLDDVVREAGIAKGTLYLYFNSKDALFAAIAERLCVEMLRNAEEAIVSSSSITSRLVGCLDAYIGASYRLTSQSPHIAELTESKEAVAATIFSSYGRKWRDLLRKHSGMAELKGEMSWRCSSPPQLEHVRPVTLPRNLIAPG